MISLPLTVIYPVGFETALVGFRVALVKGTVPLQPLLEQMQGRKQGTFLAIASWWCFYAVGVASFWVSVS